MQYHKGEKKNVEEPVIENYNEKVKVFFLNLKSVLKVITRQRKYRNSRKSPKGPCFQTVPSSLDEGKGSL